MQYSRSSLIKYLLFIIFFTIPLFIEELYLSGFINFFAIELIITTIFLLFQKLQYHKFKQLFFYMFLLFNLFISSSYYIGKIIIYFYPPYTKIGHHPVMPTGQILVTIFLVIIFIIIVFYFMLRKRTKDLLFENLLIKSLPVLMLIILIIKYKSME